MTKVPTLQSTCAWLLERVPSDLVETERCRSLCRTKWQMAFKDNLWDEICSEFDARRLAEHIRAARLPLSDAFRRFEDSWLRDEDQHYVGFRRLYSTLYHVPPDEVAARVEARPSTFAALTPFLVDEFHLCVLLAYDEIVTAKAYASDFDMYDALGDRQLSAWIRQVCRDETNHFCGVVGLIKRLHGDRLAGVSVALDELIRFNAGSSPYSGSFVLDHQYYAPELIERGRRAVLAWCRARAADSIS
jgi:hypothetical protein